MDSLKHIVINSLKKRKLIIGLIFILFILLIIFLQQTQVLPQKAISLIDEALLPAQNENVLIFSPHADDETLSSAGYIQKSLKRKANVFIVLITDSNYKHLKNRRYVEFFNTTNTLKIPAKNIFLLNYPDKKLALQNQSEVSKVFADIITKVNPAIIIYPSIYDTHIDHKTAGSIVYNILKTNSNIIQYEYIVHHKFYPKPMGMHKNYYLTPPLSLLKLDHNWVKLSMSTNEENFKCNLILSYKTQLNFPILKELLPSFCRQNELFMKPNPLFTK